MKQVILTLVALTAAFQTMGQTDPNASVIGGGENRDTVAALIVAPAPNTGQTDRKPSESPAPNTSQADWQSAELPASENTATQKADANAVEEVLDLARQTEGEAQQGDARAERTGAGVYTLTLEDCLRYAMGNNYDREAIRLNEEIRRLDYEQSRMERLPGVSASIGESLSHTTGNSTNWNGNYGLDASMTLWQGGSLRYNIEQNRLQAEQAVYQTYQYDNQLTISILQTFLAILGNEELLRYQNFVVRASEQQLREGRAQYEAGMILESDYLLLESQYANDVNNITETSINRENNLLTLKGLLSMDMLSELRITEPDTTSITELAMLPSRDAATRRALLTMPDLEIIRYNVDIAETNLRISRAGFFPSLTLGGSIGSGHSPDFQNYGTQLNDRFNQQAGLSMSIPLFNKGRTRTIVKQSRIALQQALLDEQQTELDITQEVLQQYNNVMQSLSSYRASSVRENAYRESFEAYRVQFNVGSITTVELLQQQNNYISALNDYIQNKYTFILRRKILDVYMGERITM